MAIVATSSSTVLLQAIRELAEYRREDPIATAFNVGNSFYATNEQWRRAVSEGKDAQGRKCFREPKTSAEIMAHYRRCASQVEQQVFATYGIPGEVALRERIAALAEPGMSVLDFGAGIGSQLLPLVDKGCRCTHADVGGVMMEYAIWRYMRQWHAEESKRLGESRGPVGVGRGGSFGAGNVLMVELADDYMTAGIPALKSGVVIDTRPPWTPYLQYDMVICTEVIEHVTEPEQLVALLAKLVRPGGLFVATTSFDDGDGMVPMHLNIDKYDDETFAAKVFPRHGLVPVEHAIFRKT
jgi:2-polyprenyl-3-methyl-5-hydroxy-6-metoxy-1,4-benzoquinol methylase